MSDAAVLRLARQLAEDVLRPSAKEVEASQHYGAVRAVAESTNAQLRRDWLKPLCLGQRRAGLALAGTMPGPPMLRARPARGGYFFDGTSPWVTGWGLIADARLASSFLVAVRSQERQTAAEIRPRRC